MMRSLTFGELPQDDKFFDNQERMGREKEEVDRTRQAQTKS
jgi:hypothetical protein